LGNAYKRGNGRDRTKAIVVEVTATPRGVFVAVTDEGSGFDVRRALRQARSQATPSGHRGAGFRAYDRASAIVSFENGGRTFMMCSAAESAAAHEPIDLRTTSGALAQTKLRWLSGTGAVTPEAVLSSVVFRDPLDPAWYARYLARLCDDGVYVPLTGRMFATRDQADADIANAQAVGADVRFRKLHVASPVAQGAHEPRLVLYRFDPWMNVWELLDDRGSAKMLRRSCKRIGSALRTLHSSALPFTEISHAENRERSFRAGAEAAITENGSARDEPRNTPGASGDAAFQETVDATPVPSHGSLSWSNLHYGVDGRFYLSHWEHAARTHPGIDIAGFVADLLIYCYGVGDDALLDSCLGIFRRAYTADAPPENWWTHLGEFVRGEILLREAREGARLLPRRDGARPATAELLDRAANLRVD
jgi:hypothetical protein